MKTIHMNELDPKRKLRFVPPMAQIIWQGKKTQTRRILELGGGAPTVEECEYGKEGDLLWIQETHGFDVINGDIVLYKGEHPEANVSWFPARRMTLTQARSAIRISKIRVMQLQDISDADIVAEGASLILGSGELASTNMEAKMSDREAFRAFWDRAYDFGNWEDNPWVCAISFQPMQIIK